MSGRESPPFPLTPAGVPCCGYALALPRAGKFLTPPAPGRRASRIEHRGTLRKGAERRRLHAEQASGVPRRGLKVVYATDSRPCPAIVGCRPGTPTCSAWTRRPRPTMPTSTRRSFTVTLPARETGETAAAAQVRRLWLTHIQRRCQRHRPRPGRRPGRVCPAAVAGYDGLTETLEFDKT